MGGKVMMMEHVGWLLEGTAIILPWGSPSCLSIDMDPTYVPLGQLTKDTVHRCINDGQFGCEHIVSAEVEVYEVYECGATRVALPRTVLNVRKPNPKLVCRGI
jgi:hypothetical protein